MSCHQDLDNLSDDKSVEVLNLRLDREDLCRWEASGGRYRNLQHLKMKQLFSLVVRNNTKTKFTSFHLRHFLCKGVDRITKNSINGPNQQVWNKPVQPNSASLRSYKAQIITPPTNCYILQTYNQHRAIRSSITDQRIDQSSVCGCTEGMCEHERTEGGRV